MPYQLVELVRSYLRIVANTFAAEPEGVGSNAAVISVIPLMSFGCSLAHFLRVVGVTALSANSEPLQQAQRRIIPALACQLAVLGKLLLNDFEQCFADDRRHRNFDPLLPVRAFR